MGCGKWDGREVKIRSQSDAAVTVRAEKDKETEVREVTDEPREGVLKPGEVRVGGGGRRGGAQWTRMLRPRRKLGYM